MPVTPCRIMTSGFRRVWSQIVLMGRRRHRSRASCGGIRVSTPRRAMVVDAALIAPGVQSVRLGMSDGEKLGHRAGQYVLLHARAADGSVVKRAYSIASP